MNLSNLKISQKLGVIIALVLVALAAVSGLGIQQTERIYEITDTAHSTSYPQISAVNQVWRAFAEIQEDTVMATLETDPARIALLSRLSSQNIDKIEKSMEDYKKLVSDEEERGLLAAEKTAFA